MKLILMMLFSLAINANSFAQEVKPDSLQIAKTAVTDADKYLKINSLIRKAHRQKKLYSTSDYFKPTLQKTSNPKLLADSNYVKVYRHTAHESTLYQLSLHKSRVVIVAIIVAGVVVTAVIVVKIAEAFGNALNGIFGGLK